MIFNFNPNDIIDAVYLILSADSVIKGSSYLNATAKNIHKSKAPLNFTGRHLVIEMSNWTPDMVQGYSGELRIHCYVRLSSNKQIDEAGNKILNRCEQLLNEEMLSLSGAETLPLRGIGIVPFFHSDEMGPNAKGVARFQVEAKKTG